MCLLAHKPASVRFSYADIADICQSNADGFGVMYAEDGVLYTVKIIGSVEDVWKTYQQVETRELLMHFRMRTHGDIDLENCHPYDVFGDGREMPLSLMHNGVLHTGNAKDETKSDTWHYIRDYLVPLLQADPSFLTHPAFEKFVASHIGSSNKFALLNAHGEMVIVNRKSGVDWKRPDGTVWMSNTYAWSAERAGFGRKSRLKVSLPSSAHTAIEGDNDLSNPMLFDGDFDVYDPRDAYEANDGYDDRDEWRDELWVTLDVIGYHTAYRTIPSAKADAFYDGIGVQAAWRCLEHLAEGHLSEDDLLHTLLGPGGADAHTVSIDVVGAPCKSIETAVVG